MKKLIVLAFAVAFAACSEGPVQPILDDIDPQFAKGDNGADVYKDKWTVEWSCYGDEYFQYCYEYSGMVHRVATPSGNYNYFYREDGSWEYNDLYWQYSEVGTSDYNYKWHMRQGDEQVHSWSDTYEYTYTYFELTVACWYSYRYHFANGKVTKYLSDSGCEVQ